MLNSIFFGSHTETKKKKQRKSFTSQFVKIHLESTFKYLYIWRSQMWIEYLNLPRRQNFFNVFNRIIYPEKKTHLNRPKRNSLNTDDATKSSS